MTKFDTDSIFMEAEPKMLFPSIALIFFSKARSLSAAGSGRTLGFGGSGMKKHRMGHLLPSQTHAEQTHQKALQSLYLLFLYRYMNKTLLGASEAFVLID